MPVSVLLPLSPESSLESVPEVPDELSVAVVVAVAVPVDASPLLPESVLTVSVALAEFVALADVPSVSLSPESSPLSVALLLVLAVCVSLLVSLPVSSLQATTSANTPIPKRSAFMM